MRNILDDKPTRDLHGGPAFARSFVEDEHCSDRAILDIGCGFGWFELIALDLALAQLRRSSRPRRISPRHAHTSRTSASTSV